MDIAVGLIFLLLAAAHVSRLWVIDRRGDASLRERRVRHYGKTWGSWRQKLAARS